MAILFLAGQETPQMNADDLAAIPGTAERVIGGRSPRGGRRCSGGDCRRIQRAPLKRTLGSLRANLRRRHRAERDARPNNPSAARRQVSSESNDGPALWLDA